EGGEEGLELVKEGPRSQEIRVAEEGVRQAEVALQEAEANRAKRQISDSDVDAAQAQVRQAEAAVDAAKAALAQKGWNEDEIRNAEAEVNKARADVRYSEEQIAQTHITSPVDGVVSEQKVRVGEAGSQMKNGLATIVSSDTVYFEAIVPEMLLSYVREGSPAEVTLDSLPGKVFRGTVRGIIPFAEANSRSLRLRISVPQPANAKAVVGGFAR